MTKQEEFIAITGKSGEFSDEFKAIYNSPKLIWNFITEKVIPEAIAEHEAKGETCKWQRQTSDGIVYKPFCCAIWLNATSMRVLSYIYCPFCGRKIERV